jgi:hypothetical protein
MMMTDALLDRMNGPDRPERLDALRGLAHRHERGDIPRPARTGAVNNHIHTFYSFSPYSPSKAVWMAMAAGLETAGIMDHDSVSGAHEFVEAGRILGLATTVGVEVRVDMTATPLAGRRINHPDQISSAYVAMHGIPHTRIETIARFLEPYRERRNHRNRRMTERLNEMLARHAIRLDFDADVVPLSMAHEGGSITERHLLFAVANRLIERFGRGHGLVAFLREEMHLHPGEKVIGHLLDADNPHYAYDLLGALKSELVPRFYLDADDECPDVREYLAVCHDAGAIAAYAYLGDVGDSVTGDKKTQQFEDAFLPLLFETLRDLGFEAVTYMPSRNTLAQLERVQALCREYGFFQISGEDINSPRQSFVCEAMQHPAFRHLVDATWALIGHERAATDGSPGMFSPDTVARYPDLEARIRHFQEIGRSDRITQDYIG